MPTRRQFLTLALSVGLALAGLPRAFAENGNGSGSGGGNGNGNGGGNNRSASSTNPSSEKAAKAAATPAPPSEQDQALRAVRSGAARPLAELLPGIEERYRGQVIDAALRQSKGALVYDLKLISEAGHIFRVSINAMTGVQ